MVKSTQNEFLKMGERKTYSELLRSPKWQRRRLEILSRDNWKCTKCQNSDENLQVHHIKYITGLKPWEYSDDLLTTICETCHKKEHGISDSAQALINVTQAAFETSSSKLVAMSSAGNFSADAIKKLKEERMFFRNSFL